MGNLESAENGWMCGGHAGLRLHPDARAGQKEAVTNSLAADTVAVAEKAVTFHELYERYAGDVYRFACWLAGNAEDARDLTSETFVRVWTAEAEPRAETVKAYLFTITRNLHRKQWRRASRQQPMPEDILLVDPAAHPDVATADKEELEQTMAAIGELSENDRMVLLLRAYDGLSYEEIAAITGISPAAAKVKVFRARARLAARLKPDFERIKQ